MNHDALTFAQLVTILSASLRSRRFGKRACRDLLGDGSAEMLDRVLDLVAQHPDCVAIEHEARSAIAEIDAVNQPVSVPHDPWIFGDGPSGRMYIAHTRRPRFRAELFDQGEEPADGVVCELRDGSVIANIDWIDPPLGDLRGLLLGAQAAIEEMDAITDAKIDAAERADEN